MKNIITFLLLVFLAAPAMSETFTGPKEVTVPGINIRVFVPTGWDLRYLDMGGIDSFGINNLNAPVSLNVSELEGKGTAKASAEKHVANVRAMGGKVIVTSKGPIKAGTTDGYILEYTYVLKTMTSWNFVACFPRGKKMIYVNGLGMSSGSKGKSLQAELTKATTLLKNFSIE